ncbi:MAG: LapA family protein [Blastocatellia bacterium]|nr:LapA family protein [Blastocatellia bacterium]
MRKKPIRTNARRHAAPQAVTLQWKHFLLIVICVAVMASGFFFAALQHFSSIDLSIKNSRLRKQIDDLEAERRRLWLAREMALSPVEIKKNARKLGFAEFDAAVEFASMAMTAAPAEAVPLSTRPEAVERPAARVESAYPRANDERKPRTTEQTPTAEAPGRSVESQPVKKPVQRAPEQTDVRRTAAVRQTPPAPPTPAVVKAPSASVDSRPRRVASAGETRERSSLER